MYTKIFGVY